MASVGSGEIPSCKIALSLRYYFREMLDDHVWHLSVTDSLGMFKLVHASGTRSVCVGCRVDSSLTLQVFSSLLREPFEVFIRVHGHVIPFHEMLRKRLESLPIKDEQIPKRMY